MNNVEATDTQIILSYFLDPDGTIEDDQAQASALRLANAAFKRSPWLPPGEVADMFAEMLEAAGELDDDGRPIEDVPVGDLL